MVEDSPVVKDIRRIRCAISEKFDHDVDKYIEYLKRRSEASGRAKVTKPPSESLPEKAKSTCNKD